MKRFIVLLFISGSLLLLSCEESSGDPGVLFELINGDGLNSVEGIIGDTLVVLILNINGSKLRFVEFDLYEWTDDEKRSIYFETLYDVNQSDTIKFLYPIPLETTPIDPNNTYTRLHIRLVSKKGGMSNMEIFPIFVNQ